jgi:hypothetical protein
MTQGEANERLAGPTDRVAVVVPKSAPASHGRLEIGPQPAVLGVPKAVCCFGLGSQASSRFTQHARSSARLERPPFM